MKVLIVEDDTMLSNLLKDELNDSGFDVYQAFDGEDGLEKIKEKNPDLVLLDLMMPKKDGIEVLTDVKELKKTGEYKDFPVLIITASENEFKLSEAFEAGATEAMLKSKQTMKSIIERVQKYQQV